MSRDKRATNYQNLLSRGQQAYLHTSLFLQLTRYAKMATDVTMRPENVYIAP